MEAVRTIFVSDLHLGCRNAQAEKLLDLLKRHRPQFLYLVGDIIDGWRLKRRWHWPPAYNRLVKRVLKLMKHGTLVYYNPGNHDEFLRPFVHSLGGIQIADEFIHRTADGRRLLILHGDRFDMAVRHARWLALAGDIGYNALLTLNRHFNRVRRRLGFPYWSLSAAIKRKVKRATCFISDFENLVTRHAGALGCDGVVCGHIHTPKIADKNGVLYLNAGDWVESCSALIERLDGRIELIYHDADASSPIQLFDGFDDQIEAMTKPRVLAANEA